MENNGVHVIKNRLENEINNKDSNNVVHNVNDIGSTLFIAMKKYSKNVAQYITDTSETQTYDEVLKNCIRTALKLKIKHFEKDDSIGLCTGNHKHSCVPYLASFFLGIKACCFDITLAVKDMAHLLGEVAPKIMFVAPEAVQLMEKSLKMAKVDVQLVVFGKSLIYEEFNEYLKPHPDENSFEPVPVIDSRKTAVILFSSGTTGLPKGICNSHYGLLNQARQLLDNKTVTSVTLYYSTLNRVTGFLFLSACTLRGFPRIIVPGFSGKQAWKLIDKFRVSSLFLLPHQCIEMIEAGKPEEIDASSLLNMFTVGSPLNKTCIKQLQTLIPNALIYQLYGQTEAAGFITRYDLNCPKDRSFIKQKLDSCGKLVSGFSYKIIDTETEKPIVGSNQKGELRLKSKSTMNGYFNMDSSETYDEEGWLKTGDVVYYDEDDCFYITGRIKELIKYKSLHVQPAWLENVLLQHPAVHKATVIGIPHQEDGEHPIGLVILNIGDENTCPHEIRRFVDERVEERKKLRAGVKIIKEIPVTPTGKVRRQLLLDMILTQTI